MTTPTVAVTIESAAFTGSPVANGSVTIQMTAMDVVAGTNGTTVANPVITVPLDASGKATEQLFPNSLSPVGLGTRGTSYKVTILDSTGAQVGSGFAQIPNSACNLHDNLVDIANPTGLTDGVVAVQLARSYRDQAQAVLSDAGFVAVKSDLPNIDAVANSIANVNTVEANLSAINANVSNMPAIQSASSNATAAQNAVTQAQAAANTATNQAGLAASSAASASSVAQQDLSGVTAAALHRSPNAVVAMCIDDVSKHSDPSWPERCGNLSYLSETLNGSWLGQCANETAARAVSGATTGSYFQNSTDGKFYSLNAGSGVTEVFRGNTAKYPRADGWVGESARVAGYSLDDIGRPMWMSFTVGATNAIRGTTISSMACGNGWLLVGTDSGLTLIDFANDRAYNWGTGGRSRYLGTIAQRNAGMGWLVEDSTKAIASNTVNAVSVVVTNAAPGDPVTGLQVPTIQLLTAGGMSVIQNNGNVVNSALTSAFVSGSITTYGVTGATAAGEVYFASAPSSLGASFALTQVTSSLPGFAYTQPSSYSGSIQPKRQMLLKRHSSQPKASLVWLNESNPAASLQADVTNTYATGLLVGDIRRAYLCDTAVGVFGEAVATEICTDPGFDNPGAWSVAGGGWSVSGGVATATAANNTYLDQNTSPASLVSAYHLFKMTVTVSNYSAGSVSMFVGTNGAARSPAITANGTYTYYVQCDGSAGQIGFVGTNFSGTLDNFSCKDVGAVDRSYKSKALHVFGTVTRSQVATGAQLTAISGFGAGNYLQEVAYSADLDAFGRIGAWVNYTTAAVSTIADRNYSSGAYWTLGTDASGHLTATLFDGTTTRTVTSTAAYNTGTWIKVVAEYSSSGTLYLKVNGVVVASTTGNPLGALTNTNAVLTVGNNYALTAAFPGSIALLRIGATVATPDQSVFCYEQEKEMFVAGAQITLPDSGNLVDLDYDAYQDKWKPVSAANESSFTGLVRTAASPVPAGSYTHVAHRSGMKLLSRSTTNPGVDVTLPPQNLKEELLKRSEAAANQARITVTLDWVGGFTATTATGSALLTSVAGLTIPTGATIVGAQISGTGIPAGTTITDYSGTTIQMSAPATASGSGVAISFLDFILPVGMEARRVDSAGAKKQEGASKDWTRRFDGFREGERFGAAPGSSAWVSIDATRRVVQ